MNKATQIILYVCMAIYVSLAVLTAVEVKNTAQKSAEQAQRAMQTAIGERDNALRLAEQYKMQYQQAVLEIAELKEQIDVLRTPPDGMYNDEFGWDYDYVVRVVGAEARGEPFAGMLAVAQCIADTAEKTGKTPEQIVKGWGYADPVDHTVLDGMEAVNEACLLVFANGFRPYDEPIEYFYSTANGGYSAWHESQVFCYEIGSHRYFKAVGA